MFQGSSGNPLQNCRRICHGVREDATYLVTGGLGMLGQSVAKWLISKGAKHLVLTGRNASAEATQELGT